MKIKPIGVVVFVQSQREIETATGENFFQSTYRRVAVPVEHAVEAVSSAASRRLLTIPTLNGRENGSAFFAAVGF